jgi:hypothetical protein
MNDGTHEQPEQAPRQRPVHSPARDYRSIPYPVPSEAEQEERRNQARRLVVERGRKLRDLAELCLAAREGAHGETARVLAEEGLDPEHYAHAHALRRWHVADADARPLEPDEKRAIANALAAFNLERALLTLAIEVRKEIAKNARKETRR